MSVDKITIGAIPAYEIGEKTAPAVIVLQVGFEYFTESHIHRLFLYINVDAIIFRNGGA